MTPDWGGAGWQGLFQACADKENPGRAAQRKVENRKAAETAAKGTAKRRAEEARRRTAEKEEDEVCERAAAEEAQGKRLEEEGVGEAPLISACLLLPPTHNPR